MNITGRTTLVGIFGHPVEHTLSPAMHNAAFNAMGLDWQYLPFAVRPERLDDAVRAVRALGLRGVNVTVPHKETVIPHLDEVDEQARRIGAVNTIVNEGGRLIGYNTDSPGFIRSLSGAGMGVEGKKAVILGAGGAARAVGFGLIAAGISSLVIVNRTLSRAERLASDLNAWAGSELAMPTSEAGPLGEGDILINSTSLGLHPSDPLPVDTTLLSPGAGVCDLIYKPARTGLLLEAERIGCRVLNGAGMLLWQGCLAFALWTGREAPASVMAQALADAGVLMEDVS